MKNKLYVLLSLLVLASMLISACGIAGNASDVGPELEDAQATNQALQTEVARLQSSQNQTAQPTNINAPEPTRTLPAPTSVSANQQPAASNGGSDANGSDENREFEMTVAGGDFFAIGVEDLSGGWMRIREAGNRDYCAWSNTFKMEISSGVAAQIPHCLEWRLTGTGSVKLTFKPDSTGYDTSDTLKTGLAFWPSGNNGSYRVTRNGVTTAWIPLTTGPEGVNFPKNGGEVTIEFKLENGFVTMPLGEIRNNVQPKY